MRGGQHRTESDSCISPFSVIKTVSLGGQFFGVPGSSVQRILSIQFRTSSFASVSGPSNTLCFTWGLLAGKLNKSLGINHFRQIPKTAECRFDG
jgi:hypothetical protein